MGEAGGIPQDRNIGQLKKTRVPWYHHQRVTQVGSAGCKGMMMPTWQTTRSGNLFRMIFLIPMVNGTPWRGVLWDISQDLRTYGY